MKYESAALMKSYW